MRSKNVIHFPRRTALTIPDQMIKTEGVVRFEFIQFIFLTIVFNRIQ